MDTSTEATLALKDCINSLLEIEEERNEVKLFLVNNFLTGSWSKRIINLSMGKEKEVNQVDFFDNFTECISVMSYDSTTSAHLFLEYFKEYPNLKGDLISEIKSKVNIPWISKMFKEKKLFFLVSDTQWKHKSVEVQARIDFVLIGRDRCPTIEINIL